MGNCLVKKIKGVVDNDNLPYLNYLKVYFKQAESADSYSNGLRFNDGMLVDNSIKTKGSIHFTDSALTEDYGQSYSPSSDSFYVSNGDGILLIGKNSTAISNIQGGIQNKKNYYIKLSEFDRTTSFVGIAVQNSLSEGDVINLVGNLGLNIINVADCPSITGDMTEFVEQQADAGRSSGTITFIGNGVVIGSLGGPMINGGYYYYEYMSSTEIKFTTPASNIKYIRKVNGVWGVYDS